MEKRASALVLLLTSLGFYALGAGGGTAQAACSNQRPMVFTWDPIAVPKPTDLCRFVKDEVSAIRLGKALFWEMQVGSDGIIACGSCHFHAGADNRVKNQISPHGAPESKS